MMLIGDKKYDSKSRYAILVERKMIKVLQNSFGKDKKIKVFDYYPGLLFGLKIKNDSFIQNVKEYEYLYSGMDDEINELYDARKYLNDSNANLRNNISELQNVIRHFIIFKK